MAFEREAGVIPTEIGQLTITLITRIVDPAENPAPPAQEARYWFEVKDQNGNVIREMEGDLVPHITQGQIGALLDFMAGCNSPLSF
jgi:hypothetical protein